MRCFRHEGIWVRRFVLFLSTNTTSTITNLDMGGVPFGRIGSVINTNVGSGVHVSAVVYTKTGQ